MYTRQAHLLWPTAALLLAGCLIETTPDPIDPPPRAELKGRLVEASGAAVPFVPVRLGSYGGPIVATDEEGVFIFPDVPAGPYNVYAFDKFEDRAAFATIEHPAGSAGELPTVEFVTCTDWLTDYLTDDEVVALCHGDAKLDLPPFDPAVTFAALELSGGEGYTNRANTGAHVESGELRRVAFSIHDGLALGGVREFEVADHRLVDDPDLDESFSPGFTISLQDRNGHQIYGVRDGSFRIEVAEGRDATRGYVLTASNLVLDYFNPDDEFEEAYTLTVPSLRLEGTLDVELPPVAPEGDLTMELNNDIVLVDHDSVTGRMTITTLSEDELLDFQLDPTQLAFPGSVDIELPLGDQPDPRHGSLSVQLESGGSWSFQLVSYTVATEQTALPGCGEQLTLTLKNLVFRYVGWDYDENSDEVRSFGEQTLTIDQVEVDAEIYDPSNPFCE